MSSHHSSLIPSFLPFSFSLLPCPFPLSPFHISHSLSPFPFPFHSVLLPARLFVSSDIAAKDHLIMWQTLNFSCLETIPLGCLPRKPYTHPPTYTTLCMCVRNGALTDWLSRCSWLYIPGSGLWDLSVELSSTGSGPRVGIHRFQPLDIFTISYPCQFCGFGCTQVCVLFSGVRTPFPAFIFFRHGAKGNKHLKY